MAAFAYLIAIRGNNVIIASTSLRCHGNWGRAAPEQQSRAFLAPCTSRNDAAGDALCRDAPQRLLHVGSRSNQGPASVLRRQPAAQVTLRYVHFVRQQPNAVSYGFALVRCYGHSVENIIRFLVISHYAVLLSCNVTFRSQWCSAR